MQETFFVGGGWGGGANSPPPCHAVLNFGQPQRSRHVVVWGGFSSNMNSPAPHTTLLPQLALHNHALGFVGPLNHRNKTQWVQQSLCTWEYEKKTLDTGRMPKKRGRKKKKRSRSHHGRKRRKPRQSSSKTHKDYYSESSSSSTSSSDYTSSSSSSSTSSSPSSEVVTHSPPQPLLKLASFLNSPGNQEEENTRRRARASLICQQWWMRLWEWLCMKEWGGDAMAREISMQNSFSMFFLWGTRGYALKKGHDSVVASSLCKKGPNKHCHPQTKPHKPQMHERQPGMFVWQPFMHAGPQDMQ